MKKLPFLLLLFFFASLTAQVKSKTFPNALNRHWRYVKTGPGTQGLPDRYLEVDVIGELQLSNDQKAKVWVFKYPNEVDTNYVVSSDDSILVYFNLKKSAGQNDIDEQFLRNGFEFPLYVGKTWGSPYKYGDSMKVIGKTTLTTPAGNFPDTYVLVNVPNTNFSIGNFRKNDTIWFTPNVGITKYYQNEFEVRPKLSNGTWLLSSYK